MPAPRHPRRCVPALATLIVFALAASAGRADGQSSPSAQPAVDLRLRSITLFVRDYDEAKRWYTEKLGFEVRRDQAYGNGRRFLQVAPPGQADIGIVLETPGSSDSLDMRAAYHDHIGKQDLWVLYTSDLTRLHDTLAARGVRVLEPPQEMPWGGQAVIEDLYGNRWVLVGRIGR